MTESVSIDAETPLVQTSSSELGDDGRRGADRGAAAERPQLRQPDPHHPRRAARHPRLQHRRRRQPGVARLGVVLGQRPAAARQQLHARRRRQQRDLAADGRDLPERRCARRVQAADQHLLGGVRPVARRRGQPADQVGHERVPRQRLRVPPQRRVRRQQLLQQPRRTGRSRTSSRTSSAARSAGRSSRTRRSSSATTRAIASRRGRRSSRRCRSMAMRNGDFSELIARHLRPARPGSRSRATSSRATASIRSRATS